MPASSLDKICPQFQQTSPCPGSMHVSLSSPAWTVLDHSIALHCFLAGPRAAYAAPKTSGTTWVIALWGRDAGRERAWGRHSAKWRVREAASWAPLPRKRSGSGVRTGQQRSLNARTLPGEGGAWGELLTCTSTWEGLGRDKSQFFQWHLLPKPRLAS